MGETWSLLKPNPHLWSFCDVEDLTTDAENDVLQRAPVYDVEDFVDLYYLINRSPRVVSRVRATASFDDLRCFGDSVVDPDVKMHWVSRDVAALDLANLGPVNSSLLIANHRRKQRNYVLNSLLIEPVSLKTVNEDLLSVEQDQRVPSERFVRITRSQGTVPEYSNVQIRTLEYKERPRKDGNYITVPSGEE